MNFDSKLAHEDGKIFEKRYVDSREVDQIIERRKAIQESQKFGSENVLAGSWHRAHVDRAINELGISGMPKNQEERARVVKWLSREYPYGIVNASNLKTWRE